LNDGETMFEERRRQKRVEVSIPIRVKWVDSKGNRVEEVTRSLNVSSDGALFPLKYPLKIGTRLELSLPLPRHLQRGASPKAVYETVALVTRIENTDKPQNFRIAVRFRSSNAKQYRLEPNAR
jgi:hypothetical protein